MAQRVVGFDQVAVAVVDELGAVSERVGHRGQYVVKGIPGVVPTGRQGAVAEEGLTGDVGILVVGETSDPTQCIDLL